MGEVGSGKGGEWEGWGRVSVPPFASSAPLGLPRAPQKVARLGPGKKRPGETTSQVGCAPQEKDGQLTFVFG